jgi:hypothetical protein
MRPRSLPEQGEPPWEELVSHPSNVFQGRNKNTLGLLCRTGGSRNGLHERGTRMAQPVGDCTGKVLKLELTN